MLLLSSGLSSSAAVEMATARALCGVSGIDWDPVGMALLGQKTEWEYIGVKGGVMDQFTATMAREGHAMLLDCRAQTDLPSSVFAVRAGSGARLLQP